MKQFPNQIYVCFKDKAGSKQPITLTEFDELKIKKLNNDGYGIFFTPNSFKDGKRTKENILKINAIFGDLDVSKSEYKESQEEIEKKKSNLLLALNSYCPPSIIIGTKNGLQPIWYVSDERIDGLILWQRQYITEGLIDWSKSNGALGDEVKDITRIIRLPNFYHHKQDPYLIQEIEGNNKIYTLEELAKFFWREPLPIKTTEVKELSEESRELDRIDIKDVVIEVWKSLGHTAIFDKTEHLIIDGTMTATFQGRHGDRQYIATSSADYPAKGNKITYTAKTLKISNKEAYRWLLERFNLTSNKKTSKEIPIELEKPIFMKDLINTDFPETQWLVENLFATGTINQISAAPNQWKSWLTQYFAIRIAIGDLIFNRFKTTKQGVLIVNEEDPARMIKNRSLLLLYSQVIQETDIPVAFFIEKGFKLTPTNTEKLIKIMEENDLKTVIFDSLSMIHDANENDAQAMGEVFNEMKKLTRAGFTVIFTNHHRKKPLIKGIVDDGQEQTRGSSVINAVPAGHITCDPFELGEFKYLTISQLKLKEEEKIKPFIVQIKIERDENFETKSIDFVYDATIQDKGMENVAEKAATEIMEVLNRSELPLSASEIIDLKPAGAGQSTVREAIKLLITRNSIDYKTRKELGMPLLGKSGGSNEKFYFLTEKTPSQTLEETLPIF